MTRVKLKESGEKKIDTIKVEGDTFSDLSLFTDLLIVDRKSDSV